MKTAKFICAQSASVEFECSFRAIYYAKRPFRKRCFVEKLLFNILYIRVVFLSIIYRVLFVCALSTRFNWDEIRRVSWSSRKFKFAYFGAKVTSTYRFLINFALNCQFSNIDK